MLFSWQALFFVAILVTSIPFMQQSFAQNIDVANGVFKLTYKNNTYDFPYSITNGVLVNITYNEPRLSAIIDSTSTGSIILEIPRKLVDSRFGCGDYPFDVVINGTLTSALQSGNLDHRILKIPLQKGYSIITIFSNPPQVALGIMPCKTDKGAPFFQILNGALPEKVVCPDGLVLMKKL